MFPLTRMFGLAAAVVLLGFAAGCRPAGKSHLNDDVAGGPPAIRVVTVKPDRKPLVRTVELPGRVEAFEVAPLFAKLTGYVTRVPVDIGDRIRGPHGDEPGQPLCELLVPELKEELAEKAAKVAQASAEVRQSEAAIKVAEAAVRSAAALVKEAQAAAAREEARYARWQSEYSRVSQLAERGALTQKVADETREQLEAADAGRKEVSARIASVEAAHQEATANVEKSEADAAAMRSRRDVAQAEHRRVAVLLDYTTLVAPFDGIVVERNVHPGHLVQAGGGGGVAPLLKVMSIDPVRVFVDVPEIDAVHIDKGTVAGIRIPSIPGDPLTSAVTRTSWSLNATSRTLTAEIDVPNPDARWRPGQYVQVTLNVAELTDILSLPKAAIVTQDKQTYCFCVGADGKVSRRAIALGLQAGNDFEIRSGLTGDENVIAVNASSFREGQVVEIAKP